MPAFQQPRIVVEAEGIYPAEPDAVRVADADSDPSRRPSRIGSSRRRDNRHNRDGRGW